MAIIFDPDTRTAVGHADSCRSREESMKDSGRLAAMVDAGLAVSTRHPSQAERDRMDRLGATKAYVKMYEDALHKFSD